MQSSIDFSDSTCLCKDSPPGVYILLIVVVILNVVYEQSRNIEDPLVYPQHDDDADEDESKDKVVIEVSSQNRNQIHLTHHFRKLCSDYCGRTVLGKRCHVKEVLKQNGLFAFTFNEIQKVISKRESQTTEICSKEQQRVFVRVSLWNQLIVTEDLDMHQTGECANPQVYEKGHRHQLDHLRTCVFPEEQRYRSVMSRRENVGSLRNQDHKCQNIRHNGGSADQNPPNPDVPVPN